jgi:hypothetical protein
MIRRSVAIVFWVTVAGPFSSPRRTPALSVRRGVSRAGGTYSGVGLLTGFIAAALGAMDNVEINPDVTKVRKKR